MKSSEASAYRRGRGAKSMTCWALSRRCLFARRPEVLWESVPGSEAEENVQSSLRRRLEAGF